MKEISILDIENIKIGNAQDVEGGTGLSVVICEKGAAAGLDIRGGGPAGRETQLLNPLSAAEKIHAVVISGGSAFGLDAAGGVMKYLEEKNIGFETGITKVPLVCQSCIFDLIVGSPYARPDKDMAYKACENAEKGELKLGNYGAGTGATVGKYLSTGYMMKSGLGAYALQLGEIKIGALVCVNALGDVFDIKSGKQIAGLLSEDKHALRSTEEEMYRAQGRPFDVFTGNTTIGTVVTNAGFDKTKMNKIAAMAQNGFARVIRPVHTTADGDSVYALSVGEVQADINTVGTLAAYVLATAVNIAVKSAKPVYGLQSCDSLI
jgi:L-aminopeptidase/D-esterase-like protein